MSELSWHCILRLQGFRCARYIRLRCAELRRTVLVQLVLLGWCVLLKRNLIQRNLELKQRRCWRVWAQYTVLRKQARLSHAQVEAHGSTARGEALSFRGDAFRRLGSEGSHARDRLCEDANKPTAEALGKATCAIIHCARDRRGNHPDDARLDARAKGIEAHLEPLVDPLRLALLRDGVVVLVRLVEGEHAGCVVHDTKKRRGKVGEATRGFKSAGCQPACAADNPLRKSGGRLHQPSCRLVEELAHSASHVVDNGCRVAEDFKRQDLLVHRLKHLPRVVPHDALDELIERVERRVIELEAVDLYMGILQREELLRAHEGVDRVPFLPEGRRASEAATPEARRCGQL
mmetsp:Transcript_22346/g.51440  ORF Transcript_22346/g.51440 Transcript_22346/m.51440 type:complete len:347 (+) Transcript_22346:120-1160(+)